MSERPRSPRDGDDLKDHLKKEISRGRKQPKRTLSIERERMIKRVAQLLANPNCDLKTYEEAIHEFGLTEKSPEYRQLIELWRKRHPNE